MFKKELLKKLFVLSLVGTMALSLTACGDEKEEKTTATTQATTEFDNTDDFDDDNFDDDEDYGDDDEDYGDDGEDLDDSAEGYKEEDGVLTIKGVSVDIPEGYVFNKDLGGTIVYLNADTKSTFAIYVENTNSYTNEQVVEAYTNQVKTVYGDHVTTSERSYGAGNYTVFDIDSADGSYVGDAALLCEDSLIVYLEYVSYDGITEDFDTLMNSIVY